MALALYQQLKESDIEEYGSVALEETPVWRNHMMKWFVIAAEAGENSAIKILEIHKLSSKNASM